jgi:hypothetical protein
MFSSAPNRSAFTASSLQAEPRRSVAGLRSPEKLICPSSWSLNQGIEPTMLKKTSPFARTQPQQIREPAAARIRVRIRGASRPSHLPDPAMMGGLQRIVMHQPVLEKILFTGSRIRT